MSTPTDLYQQALAMEPSQRAELAHLLLSSLDSPPRDPGWEEAWREEIEKRLESIDRGEVELLDGDEVMARLHRSLERKRCSPTIGTSPTPKRKQSKRLNGTKTSKQD